jgi:hypothetical protein
MLVLNLVHEVVQLGAEDVVAGGFDRGDQRTDTIRMARDSRSGGALSRSGM